jgi:hypothetical protein
MAAGRSLQLELVDDTDVSAKLTSGLDLMVPVTGEFPVTGLIWSTVETGVAGLYMRSFAEAATASLSDLELLADPDGDGFSNLIEYALGTHPFQSDGRASFQVRSEEGHGVVQYTYPSDRTDVLFGVSSSYGLGSLGGGPELLEEIARETDAIAGTTMVTLKTIAPVPPEFEFLARLLVRK